MEFNINKDGSYIKITKGLDVSFYPKNQVYISTCDDSILFKLLNNDIILNVNYKYISPKGKNASDTASKIIKLLDKD